MAEAENNSAAELHDLISAVPDLSSPSGSKFNEVRTWLAARLGVTGEDVSVLYVSKPDNFDVRFNQPGPAKRFRQLGLGILSSDDDVEATEPHAQDHVAKSGKMAAVALCAKSGGRWRLRSIIERPNGPMTKRVVALDPRVRVVEVGDSKPASIRLASVAEDLLVDESWLEEVAWMLEDRTHAIALYGPPGTGKTFIAQRVAAFLQPDESKRTLVQLHPSFGYEEFFEGYRPAPAAGGALQLEKRPGPLRKFARLAADHPREKIVIVLDEMNRGNLPKVFGELFFLLEYRDQSIELMYSPGERFSLPRNLYFIGTLNTADRSIALMDQALRRRFHFVGLFPGERPVNMMLRRYLERNVPNMKWVADALDEANRRLADRHLAIGPSHFMRHDLDETVLRRVWKHSVLPSIEEQLFQSGQSLDDFELEKLRKATSAKSGVASGSSDTKP